MISSFGEQADAEAVQAVVSVYSAGQKRISTEITGSIEVGRQRRNEPLPFCVDGQQPVRRLIVADRLDTQISRSHLRITPQADGEVLIQNSSRNCRITIDPGRELMPGKTCYVRGSVRLHLHHVTIVVELPKVSDRMISLGTPRPLVGIGSQFVEIGPGIDSSVEERVEASEGANTGEGTGSYPREEEVAPGAIERNALVDTLGSSFDAEQGEQLMLWLRTIAKLFYSATTNDRFLEDALTAMDRIIGFEVAIAFVRDQSEWKTLCCLVRGDVVSPVNKLVDVFDAAIADGVSKEMDRVLGRVVEWGQAVLYHAKADNEGAPAHAIVAAPVMDSPSEVAGMLVGFRRRAPTPVARDELITRLEASLVELIASGIRVELIRRQTD
ncbi:hypothetical protein [Rhodopirellula sallentina]|uniref:FHA domain-containing protein n=1 Tax=Rhodopirellula sallentina SM41 TaxID=1263870 RepID=M5U828_9BACT|nr:hypothetical protein [Rhodopirellula sallentina]EMI57600.1 hypothetical protein RSSM_00946 [Rhodopirellula sallentina SM41]